jgi:hypothetical protein
MIANNSTWSQTLKTSNSVYPLNLVMRKVITNGSLMESRSHRISISHVHKP